MKRIALYPGTFDPVTNGHLDIIYRASSLCDVLIIGVAENIGKKFVTRTMLPLSLSQDHRIIDGAEAARFNNDLKENLGKNIAYKLAV